MSECEQRWLKLRKSAFLKLMNQLLMAKFFEVNGVAQCI